jgi:hypothetical protein
LRAPWRLASAMISSLRCRRWSSVSPGICFTRSVGYAAPSAAATDRPDAAESLAETKPHATVDALTAAKLRLQPCCRTWILAISI